ncbi:sensor domain-containing protein, partial [Ilumatobacter sp.]|uniref:sensor domain-containing protein n=1 Tax=Ilumatobacter sp. TaxID=1967498 RepID=UPI003C351FA2
MVNPLRPWSRPGRLFRAAAYIAVGLPFGIVVFVVTVVALALSIGLMPAFLLGVPVGWIGLMMSRGLAQLERSRAGAYTNVIPDSVAPLVRGTWFGRLAERLRSKARWREIAHHLLQLPVNAIGFAVVAATWCGSVAMALLPSYVGAFPDDSAKFYFFEVGSEDPARWAALAVGVIGILLVAPWITLGAATTEWTLADRLLGPTDEERLAVQVTELRTSRTAAVDSAEAERRRIERDLHDGA